MLYVTKANYVDGYRIRLAFNTHEEGIVDLSATIRHDHRRIFRELQDKEQFRKFRVEADTVVWDNGLDLAPGYLHQKLLSESVHPTATH